MFFRIQPTTLVQIFCELSLYSKVIFKSMRVADDTFWRESECEWVKEMSILYGIAIILKVPIPHHGCRLPLGRKHLVEHDSIIQNKVVQVLMIMCMEHYWPPKWGFLNPFTPKAAKTGLPILEIFCLERYFLENSWSRNVEQMPYNNSPSNILWILALFPSYFQKYESSRRYFLEKLWVWMG